MRGMAEGDHLVMEARALLRDESILSLYRQTLFATFRSWVVVVSAELVANNRHSEHLSSSA